MRNRPVHRLQEDNLLLWTQWHLLVGQGLLIRDILCPYLPLRRLRTGVSQSGPLMGHVLFWFYLCLSPEYFCISWPRFYCMQPSRLFQTSQSPSLFIQRFLAPFNWFLESSFISAEVRFLPLQIMKPRSWQIQALLYTLAVFDTDDLSRAWAS